MTERSLRQPSGKRGKGFDGLTYGPREWLKYRSGVTGPSEIMFGIKVLAWWHRDVWNSGMKNVPQKTFGEYMRWFLANTPNVAAYVSADGLATLRKLYELEDTAAGSVTSAGNLPAAAVH